MTREQELTRLVEAAKAGDQDAWNRLVERYVPLVMSIAARYRLSPDDAADVSQTLWLRLVEHLEQIREPLALPGWIVTTTKNEALRLVKARNRSIPVDPLVTLVLDGDSDAADVDGVLLKDERHQALREAMAQLRPRHRELLLLLLAEPPLSYDQVSQRLGMPKGSIGPTRARCLEELRRTTAFRAFVDTDDSLIGR